MRNTQGSHLAHCSQGVGLCNVSVNLLSGILRGRTPPTVAKGVEQCSASVNLLSGGGRLKQASVCFHGRRLLFMQLCITLSLLLITGGMGGGARIIEEVE